MSIMDDILNRTRAKAEQTSKEMDAAMEASRKLTEGLKKKVNQPMDAGDAVQPEPEPSVQVSGFAQVYNYITVDAINGKPATAFRCENSKKRKGLLAPHVEIFFLEPGYYEITAHGVTYQTSPAVVADHLDAGKYYCLGAAEDGLYLEERPYEWTL